MNIYRKNIKQYGYWLFSLVLAITSIRCVESLSDTSTSTTPSITIYSPVTGDTVKVGSNNINYAATDGSGGTGLSYYEIFINDTYVKKVSQNTDGTNPVLTLNIDSTLLHSTISYYVIVYNKSGKLKVSKKQENIYVKDKLPNAPSNLILSKVDENTALLHWDDNSANEAGFELWRKDLGSGVNIDYRKMSTFPANTITTRDIGLSPFVNYYYKIRAFNESGYSDFSPEASTTGLSGGAWNLKAEAIGASAVHLTWTDFVTNEDGFLIERTNPNTSTYEVLTITDANTTEYYDNSVQANTGYSYRIAYFVKQSNSAFSNSVSVTTYYKDFPAPSNLAGIYYPGQGVQLSWTDNNKNIQQGTIIERKGGNGSTDFVVLTTVGASLTTYLDATVEPGVRYIYRVRQLLDKNTYTPYSSTLIIDIPN